LGKGAHASGGAAQQYALQAVLVIEVAVRGRDHEFMVILLQLREPLRELALVAAEDIGNRGDAAACERGVRVGVLELGTKDVAHGLTARGIPALAQQAIEVAREAPVKGDRETVHQGAYRAAAG